LPGSAVADATAPDQARKLPWGVLVYTSSSGLPCAIAAQLRAGNEPGLIANGVFHPNEPKASGACGKRGLATPFFDIRFITSTPARSVVYGRAHPGSRQVTFQVKDGGTYRARVGRRGGFLFVFSGRLGPGPYHLAVH
jgi:hypothetical protein